MLHPATVGQPQQLVLVEVAGTSPKLAFSHRRVAFCFRTAGPSKSDQWLFCTGFCTPEEEDLSKGILDAIDLDSYRVEKQAMQKILLPDEDAEIGPVPTSAGGHRPEADLDRLSNILRTFNEHFGDIRWEDADRVTQLIIETIPARVAADTAFRNARQNSDRQNARIEHDKALLRVMTSVMPDDTELFKQFMDNASFKRWLNDTVFSLAYEPSGTP